MGETSLNPPSFAWTARIGERIGTSGISVVEPSAIIAELAKLGFQAEGPAKTIRDPGADDTVASPGATIERQKAGGVGETLYDRARRAGHGPPLTQAEPFQQRPGPQSQPRDGALLQMRARTHSS
jgi:hypothetical protein